MASTADQLIRVTVLAGGVFILSTGCARLSLFPEQAPPPPPDTAVHERAAGLAHYGSGLIAEIHDDTETAIHHYREAADRDPAHFDLIQREVFNRLQNQQVAEAEQRMNEAMDQHAGDARAHLLMALVHRANDDFPAARASYQTAQRLEPEEPMHAVEEAALFMREDDSKSARALLLAAAPRIPSDRRLPLDIALAEISLRDAAHAMSRREPIDLSEEIALLEPAVSDPESDEMLLFLVGDLFIMTRQFDRAIECFTLIEERNPGDLRARERLSLSFMSLGSREEAIAIVSDLAERNPANPRLRYYLGELLEQDGQVDQAIAAFTAAADLEPTEVTSYLKRAYIYLSEERIDEAEAVLRQGQTHVPEDRRIDEMIGYVHLAREDYADALTHFEKVILAHDGNDFEPILTHFRVNYAIALQMTGRTEDAAQALAEAAEDGDQSLRGYFSFIWKQDDPETQAISVQVLREAQAKFPAETWIHTQTALVFKRSEAYDLAVDAFQRTLDIAEDDGSPDLLGETFFFWFGAACERNQDYERALEHFLHAITLKPDFADAHNYLAYMLAEQAMKLDLAYDHIDIALALEPDNPAYIDTRGWIYYQRGDYEKALAYIERAATELADDPVINDHLGDIHDKLGNRDQAIHHWTVALEHDPENEQIQAKLAATQPEPADEPEAEPEAVEPETTEEDSDRGTIQPLMDTDPGH